jgi:hypothetical protein
VNVTCHPYDPEILDSGGYRAPADAMHTLSEHEIIGDLNGTGRQLSGRWVTREWNSIEEFEVACPVQSVIDDIFFMFVQYIGVNDGRIKLRASRHQHIDAWNEALEYLASINVARIIKPFRQKVGLMQPRWLNRWNINNHHVIDAVDALVDNHKSFWLRRHSIPKSPV